jgi:hypothetical protein
MSQKYKISQEIAMQFEEMIAQGYLYIFFSSPARSLITLIRVI